MVDQRVVLSSRIDPEVNEKLMELVNFYQAKSVGTVNKRVVIEKAINELHEKELKKRKRQT